MSPDFGERDQCSGFVYLDALDIKLSVHLTEICTFSDTTQCHENQQHSVLSVRPLMTTVIIVIVFPGILVNHFV